MDHHKAVFSSELVEAKGVTAKLYVSNNTKTYFCKAWPVLHALKGKVEQELEHLKQQKVIELIQMSEWATLIVSVWRLMAQLQWL